MSGENLVEPVVYTPVSAAANLRRSAIFCAALSVIAIVFTSLGGHPLAGVLGAVGVAIGAVNNRMLQKSVIAHATAGTSKRKFRGGVGMRLGGVTVIAVALAYVLHPDGFGLVVGLAVFEVVMLIGAALPVFRSMRPHA